MNAKKEKDSPHVNFMPPAALFISFGVGAVFEFIFRWNFEFPGLAARIIIGLIFAAGGFVFMMFGHEKFKKEKTAIKLNQPARKLVMAGAYRYSRNPMYFGLSVMFIGIAVAAGSWSLLIAYLAWFSYLEFYAIPHEESYLKRAFGQEYENYCKKVRRWI